MKKNKANPFDHDRMPEQDTETIEAIQTGLGKLDEFPVHIPDQHWFEQMIVQEKQQMRKKLARDLSIFAFIAFCVLSIVIISLYQMPVIFITMQIAAVVFIVLYLGAGLVKRMRWNEE